MLIKCQVSGIHTFLEDLYLLFLNKIEIEICPQTYDSVSNL